MSWLLRSKEMLHFAGKGVSQHGIEKQVLRSLKSHDLREPTNVVVTPLFGWAVNNQFQNILAVKYKL